jgi:lipid A ethanolaminephosphotransferase
LAVKTQVDPTPSPPPAHTRLFGARAEGRLPVWFALLVAAVLVAACNRRFWNETLALSPSPGFADWLFLASLFVVLVAVHASVLLLVPGRRPLKAAAILLALAGAIGAYFADTYGVGIDREMMRNVIETDRREALALMNAHFALYIVLLAVVPAVWIVRTRIRTTGVGRQILQRGLFIAGALLVSVACIALMSARYASFIREHKNLRHLITPANIVYGSASLFSRDVAVGGPSALVDLESPVRRVGTARKGKPLVMFLVIGETARAHNFQLGGYARATNPELMRSGVDYFANVSSCGTSTAVSLPCMFTGIDRKDFDAHTAARSTNLVDAIAQAGIAVEWRDNNAGCKGLCARVPTTLYTGASSAKFCTARGGCYDEVMLSDLPDTLARIKQDTVIVFHQAGSHGPAYSERYPKAFEVFKPVCLGNELSRCAKQEVVNAYDNSLVYTDYNLARQIDALKSASSAVDALLLYVSDHGESLGEKGLYLHGAPYLVAPDEQTKVPLLMWLSPGYRERVALSGPCVAGRSAQPFSHANLYHTVLGALGVTSARYRPGMDMLAPCRSAASTG